MKKAVSAFIAFCLCICFTVPAFATSNNYPTSGDRSEEVSVQRAEKREWRYRLHNGQPQKRLWSITYEYWVTDWMPLETPYP